MLVLTRKAGEKITIGPDVTVTVVAIQGSKVRLGVIAPPDVAVWREELVLDEAALPARPASRPSEARPAATR